MEVLSVILWGLAGILVLSGEEVTKFEYALTWGILMMHLILNAVGA